MAAYEYESTVAAGPTDLQSKACSRSAVSDRMIACYSLENIYLVTSRRVRLCVAWYQGRFPHSPFTPGIRLAGPVKPLDFVPAQPRGCCRGRLRPCESQLQLLCSAVPNNLLARRSPRGLLSGGCRLSSFGCGRTKIGVFPELSIISGYFG